MKTFLKLRLKTTLLKLQLCKEGTVSIMVGTITTLSIGKLFHPLINKVGYCQPLTVHLVRLSMDNMEILKI